MRSGVKVLLKARVAAALGLVPLMLVVGCSGGGRGNPVAPSLAAPASVAAASAPAGVRVNTSGSVRALVATDQADYAPGSVVTISGDNSNNIGYVAGNTVNVAVTGPNGWTASCSAVVAEGGTWSCQVTLSADPATAVGSYAYTASSIDANGNPIGENGSFTDATQTRMVSVAITPASPTTSTPLTISGTLEYKVTGTTFAALSGKSVSITGPYTIENGLGGCNQGGGASVGTDTTSGAGGFSISLGTRQAGTHWFRADYAGDGASGTYGGTSACTSVTVLSPSVDNTAPSISFVTNPASPDGDNGWFTTSPVDVTVTATDTASNISSISCTLDDTAYGLTSTTGIGTSTTASGHISVGDGEHTISCTATDASSNTTSPAATLDLKVDSVAPAITITTPPDNASYILNELVNADYGCSDATSGVESCEGSVANGSPIPTNSVGDKSFTVNAKDYAGNTSTKTNTYSVHYAVCYLYDNEKAVQAGSAVPIKFYLCDANGANVSSPAIVVNATSLVKVDNNVPGALDDSGNANPEFNFRFDITLNGGTGGYIFNLSTKSPSPALGQTEKLTSGTWKLNFSVDGASGYSVTFIVK